MQANQELKLKHFQSKSIGS